MMLTRNLSKLSLGLALLCFAAVGTLAFSRRLENQRAELDVSDWMRLREAISRRVGVSSSGGKPPETSSDVALDPPPLLPDEPEPPPPPEPATDLLAQQAEAYAAGKPKGVLELQAFRSSESSSIEGEGGRTGTAILVNVNPNINAWFVLILSWSDGVESFYHLVNASPDSQDLRLDPAYPAGLTVVGPGDVLRCDLWSHNAPAPIVEASRSSSPYARLCEDRVTLRLSAAGRRTTLEWATDFLRDNVWGGEDITVFVRENFFQDAYLATSELVHDDSPAAPVAIPGRGPRGARLDPAFEDVSLVPVELGVRPRNFHHEKVSAGLWYPTEVEGVFVSVVQPNVIHSEILASHRDVVSRLDPVEAEALVYLVAFDLERFDLGFAMGTEHPRVDWSERVLDPVRNDSLPGPDGIGDVSPLIMTGIVPPGVAHGIAATFVGGFKRGHGAFRESELASRNQGSHYGFIESGAVLSKLQPGLSTVFVLDDGRVDMKTWTVEDDALLPRIKFARQNGVPIIDSDPETGSSFPGALVSRWGAGNWSGSQDKKFRTVRAGLALQESEGGRFLIYAYFSSATPSSMARVFQSYDGKYAMLLDMNALEHTYLALYHVRHGRFGIQHLIEGMNVLDRNVGGQTLPRFLGFADNRDFFYLLVKRPQVNGP